MKPLQIGLLVLVGALGGALIMMFTLRTKPGPAPIVDAVRAPVAAPAPAVPAAPVAPPAEPKPSPVARKVEPARPVRHERTVKRARPEPVAVAQNVTPPPPVQPPVAQPAPALVQPPESAPPPETPAPQPATLQPPLPPPAQETPPPPAPTVTLNAGMVLPVRLAVNLSSAHNQTGDTFIGTLDAPLAAGGYVIAERGARVEGRVVEARKGALALELTKLDTSDGQHVVIQTETYRKTKPRAAGEDAGIVAAAAGIGAVIGAMAGGGKGAAIGAGAGGAAGAGGVVATRERAVALPIESRISFRLRAPVTLTERMNR